ncbi:MAG: hypothetical protein KKB02_13800 [Alphaproteobacteria bacterium]|nr:hypothetical protein [Alphaproteobacteria bacterium]
MTYFEIFYAIFCVGLLVCFGWQVRREKRWEQELAAQSAADANRFSDEIKCHNVSACPNPTKADTSGRQRWSDLLEARRQNHRQRNVQIKIEMNFTGRTGRQRLALSTATNRKLRLRPRSRRCLQSVS